MLITCPECENMVSDKAVFCPRCGFPFNSDNSSPVIQSPRKKANTKRMRLPNGFGRITEIKGKNLRKPFRVTVSVGKDDTGRPVGRLLKPEAYFSSYNEAYQALIKYHDDPYKYGYDITMQELFDRWFERHKKHIGERRAYGIEVVWNFCDSIKQMEVQKIRAHDIRDAIENGVRIDAKGKEVRPTDAVKADIKSVVSAMLDYAIEYEYIKFNCAKNIRVEKTGEYSRNREGTHIAFTDEEIELLKLHSKSDYIAGMMYIQCYTGFRPEELCELKISKLNMSEWSIIGGGKTKAGKDRLVPIHKNIRDLIRTRYNEAVKLGSENLFVTKSNGSFTYRIYKYQFKKTIERYGLNPDHKPHDGRKHFVTMAKKHGLDEYVIKRIVGHSIKDLTERVYTDRDIKWLHEEIAKIP